MSNEQSGKITNEFQTSNLQELIDSTPENGILKLEASVYKGAFSIESKITLQGKGFSDKDDSLANLKTIIVVPKNEPIVVSDAATFEGIVFVGEKFYEKHKSRILAEVIPYQLVSNKNTEKRERAYKLHQKYLEDFEEYSNNHERDKLYEIAENELDNALLRIESDGVVLRKVCVAGSPSNGIVVAGKAEFSCVYAVKNQFTNLVVKGGAEVSFTPINERGLLQNSFSYSFKAWGIHCNGKIFLPDSESENETGLYADCNMLQGLCLNGQINAEKALSGKICARFNFGNGFGMYEKAIANLKQIYLNENTYTALILDEEACLNVDNINSRNNGGAGIEVWGASNLHAGLACCVSNKEEGIVVAEKAKLHAEEILLTENHGEFGGLCVQDDAVAEIESFESYENQLGFFVTSNAKLKINGEESKVYDNEKGHCKLEGNAVAEFTNVSFFHEAEESGYIPMADDTVGKLFVSENASAKFNNCYFYNCPSEEYVIYVKGSASLEFDFCHFGIKPEQGIYDLNDTKIHSGICASGNASITLKNTIDINCKVKHFIKVEKSVKITDDGSNDKATVKRTAGTKK